MHVESECYVCSGEVRRRGMGTMCGSEHVAGQFFTDNHICTVCRSVFWKLPIYKDQADVKNCEGLRGT